MTEGGSAESRGKSGGKREHDSWTWTEGKRKRTGGKEAEKLIQTRRYDETSEEKRWKSTQRGHGSVYIALCMLAVGQFVRKKNRLPATEHK